MCFITLSCKLKMLEIFVCLVHCIIPITQNGAWDMVVLSKTLSDKLSSLPNEERIPPMEGWVRISSSELGHNVIQIF